MEAIYLYDGPIARGEAGYGLIKMAAAKHCLELQREFSYDDATIATGEKGKPYFTNVPLHFSVTHSGELWMCLLSDAPCGIDLQEMTECKREDIAKRYFLPEEYEAVKNGDEETFFDIWVRKEAYCKMTGQGLFGGEMPSVLEDQGEFQGTPYRFTEVEISDEMRCVICTPHEPDVQLRILG